LNDIELVQGLRRQDPAAMQWLCDCYLPSLWRFVYTRVRGDAHLAEDITSETVLAMLTAIQPTQSDLEGQASTVEIQNLGGWLRTVADRRVMDHFRAASRVQHLIERSGAAGQRSQADPAAQQELQETRLEVRQVMESLSDQQRLALEWKYLDNLSVREIAARWAITEKAAESILFRARRDLRERLEKRGRPDPSRNGKHAPRTQARHNEPLENEPLDEEASIHRSQHEPSSDKAAHELSKE
jgi:RNA polymerase sigma factor (sigma-70 family)